MTTFYYIAAIIVLVCLFVRRNERANNPKHSEAMSNKELIDTMDRLNRMALERNNGGPHGK